MADTTIKVGSRAHKKDGSHWKPVRVMAVAEGYAMVRYPRAMPHVVSLKDLFIPTEEQTNGNH